MSANLPVGGYVTILLPTAGLGGAATPLPPGTVGEDCINLPIGGKVFGFGSMLVDGTPTLSPAIFNEEGYHLVEIVASSGQRKVGVAVVDPTTVIAKVESLVGGGVNNSTSELANTLPRPLLKAANNSPATFNPLSQVTASTNKAVVLTIQLRRTVTDYEDKGTVCAHGSGRWASSNISLGNGFTDTRLVIRMSPSEVVISPLPVNPVEPPTVPLVGTLISLYPTAVTSFDSKELIPSAGVIDDSWQLVDDVAPDGNATRIEMTGSQERASWRVGDFTPSPNQLSILGVTVSVNARRENSDVSAQVVVKPFLFHTQRNERAYQESISLTDGVTYTTTLVTFLTNPFTGLPWQSGDLVNGIIHVGVERVIQSDGLALSAIKLVVEELT